MASTTFVDGETLIEASWLNDVNAVVYTPGTSTAADIANVPAGNIAATDVQAAINELDTEKQSVDATLTALAGWANGTNKVPRTTSTDVVASLDYNESTALSASTTTIPSQTVVKTAIDEVVANSTIATPDKAADYILFEDATDSTQKKALAGTLSITAGTVVPYTSATTGGTIIDFTGIPSWAKRITLIFSEISPSGTDDLLIQLGDAGGFETTTYVSTSAAISGGGVGVSTSTSGLNIRLGASAAAVLSGTLTLVNLSSNSWVSNHMAKGATTYVITGGGSKTLSDTLTQVRVTFSGSNTFDAGSINIFYE